MSKRKSAFDRPVGRALRRRRGEPTTSTSHVPNSTQAGVPELQVLVQQDSQRRWETHYPVAESNPEPLPYRHVQFEVDRQSARHGPPAGVPSERCSVFSSNPADENTTNGATPSNDIVPNPQGDVPHEVASEVDPVIDDDHPENVERNAGPVDSLNINLQDDIALAIPSDPRFEAHHTEENPFHNIGPLDGLDHNDMSFNRSGVQEMTFAMFQSPLYTTGTFSSPVPSSRCPSWDTQTPRSTSLATPRSFEFAMTLPPMTDDVVGPSSSGSALSIDFGPRNEYPAQYTNGLPSIEYSAGPNRDQYSTNNSLALPPDFWTLPPPTSNQELLPDDPDSWGHGSLTAMDDIGMAQYEDNLVNPDVQEVDEDPYLNDIRAHGH